MACTEAFWDTVSGIYTIIIWSDMVAVKDVFNALFFTGILEFSSTSYSLLPLYLLFILVVRQYGLASIALCGGLC